MMATRYPYCITKCEEAAIYLEKGDYTTAQNILATHCERDSARFEMLQIALDILQNPDSLSGLSTSQRAALKAIADDEGHPMSHTACRILEFWGGSPCMLDLSMPEDIEPRSLRRRNQSNDFDAVKAIMAYPNPASETIRVSTLIPPDCESLILNVYDIQGRTVATKNMLNHHGMIELDCAKWEEGMYLLELVSDKIKLGSTNVVVVHSK